MRAVGEELTLSEVVIVRMIHQRQPPGFRHLSITIRCGHYAPVEVIDHTTLPFPNYLSLSASPRPQLFLRNPVLKKSQLLSL